MKSSETNKNSIYRVQALERALDILDCFTFQKKEISFSELVRETGLNKTTTKRLISNLVGRGYLKKDPNSKHYRLGLRLFELGGIVFSSFSLREAATYPMSYLRDATGATLLLGVALEDQLVYMDKREGNGMIRISSEIGWRRPLHYGMLGMVLMAFQNQKDVERILRKYPLKAYTSFSIVEKRSFKGRLSKIRKDGYVVENEEAVEGIMGIAVPVRDYSAQVVAALGAALPIAERRTSEEIEELLDLLIRACNEISENLGYLKTGNASSYPKK